MTGPSTILLVDDNDDLRDVTRELLESLGHRVIPAQRAESALRIFERSSDAIDLLVSELVFPGTLTGLDLAQRLRQWKPELGVLFISTHDNHGDLKTQLENHQAAFLRKPYSVEGLVDSLGRAIAWTRRQRSEAPVGGETPPGRPAVSPATWAALPALIPGTPVAGATASAASADGDKNAQSRLRNLWRAGLSGMAVAAVVAAFQWLGVEPPSLPNQVVSSAQRGTWIEPVAPLAQVGEPPQSLRWTPVDQADRYRVSILAVDDSPLWQGESRKASATLPAEIREIFRARVVYSWLIEAVDSEGRTMAHSGRLRFQIQTDPAPLPEQVPQPPS